MANARLKDSSKNEKAVKRSESPVDRTEMRGVCAAMLAACVLSTPAAHAAPTVTEVGTLSKPGRGIAGGPAGAVWVTEPDNPGRVARVTPAGQVLEYEGAVAPGLTKDRHPAAMAVGPDGALWFVEDHGFVGRITTTGVVSEFGPLRGDPVAVAAGPDGNVWVAEDDAFNSKSGLARLTPMGDITEFRAGEDKMTSLTAGPGGALWYADENGLGRMTVSGVDTAFPDDLDPLGVAAGPDGALWFTAGVVIGRMTAGGSFTEIPVTADYATAIAAGPDGALWFTAKDSVGRVTPNGVVTEYPAPGLGVATGIAAGPDGAMWFTTEKPTLGRVTTPPLVVGAQVVDIGTSTARAEATVRANALATDATLELLGPSDAVVAQRTFAVPAGPQDVVHAFNLTGLEAATQYRITVRADNPAGPSLTTAETQFTTAEVSAPVPSPTPTPMPTATPTATPRPSAEPTPTAGPDPAPRIEPAPVLGASVVLESNRGVVRVRPSGASRFSPLGEQSAVPLGALVDTSLGSVVLESALPGGATQTGTFHGGLFRVGQAADGTTRLRVAGRLSCTAPARTASVSRRGRKRKRKLWGSDDGGKFTTRGRDSVATVRGTRWLTMDTCRGTTTRVVEGAVSVVPRGGGAPVLVRAGERHFVSHR